MMEQYIDYHLFQGIDLFMCDHTFNQDHVFYHLFCKNQYMSNNIVTLIDWPMSIHPRNLHPGPHYKESEARNNLHWFHQKAVWLDSMRRFMYDSKLLHFGDADEFVIPISENRNAKQTLQYFVNKQKNNNNNDNKYAFAIRTYTGLPDVYTLLGYQHTDNYTLKINTGDDLLLPHEMKNSKLFTQEIDFVSQRILGCNKSYSLNKYDTFLQRHSCLHWQTQSIYITNDGKYSKYPKYKHISNLNQLDQNSDAWFKKLKQYLYKDCCTLSNCSKLLGLFKKLMVTNPGSSEFDNKDFAMIKNIIQPRHMFVATMHTIEHQRSLSRDTCRQSATPKRFELSFECGLFAIHARDHWSKINPKTKYDKDETVVEWSNPCDVKLFYGLLQSNCNQHQYIVLEL